MDIENVLDHYIAAALGLSTDDLDEPLDVNYDRGKLHQTTLDRMRADVTRFVEENEQMLLTWAGGSTTAEEQAGHDFWLTRNGHGVGFWEDEWGDVKDQLTDAAHQFGECYPYVGDDDKIYL